MIFMGIHVDHWEFMMIFMGFPEIGMNKNPSRTGKSPCITVHLELNGPRFQRIRGLRSGN